MAKYNIQIAEAANDVTSLSDLSGLVNETVML